MPKNNKIREGKKQSISLTTSSGTTTEQTEIWKDIIGYEGLYQVSNLGGIKSLDRKYSKGEYIMNPTINHYGYKVVNLSKNKHKKFFSVHRLVSIHFIDNANNYDFVNHKDENKTNNVVTNLEWCTSKYNTNYGTCIQRRSAKQKNKHGAKRVSQYTMSLELIKEYPSIMEATRFTSISPRDICACCRGYKKSAYGYKWKYAKNHQSID